MSSFGNMPPLFDILTRLPPNEEYQLLEKLATKLLSARKQNPTWNEYDMCSFFVSVAKWINALATSLTVDPAWRTSGHTER